MKLSRREFLAGAAALAATTEGRARVRAALEGLPQIARAFDKSDLGALRASDKLGDLVAEAREPWGFGLSDRGVAQGAHGSLQEIKVPLVLAGAGVRRGAPPQNPVLVDIAPTIAALLGSRPPPRAGPSPNHCPGRGYIARDRA